MINLAINGRFLSHHMSGVVRVAVEFTKTLDALILDGEIAGKFRLICPNNVSADKLGLRAITVEHVGGQLQGHAWEQLALPFYAAGDHLLCLGNTAPIYSLIRGKRVAVMIHDMSYRLFPNAYYKRYRVGHSIIAPFLLKLSNPIITVSQSEKGIIAKLSPSAEKHIVVAQNGGWRAFENTDLQRRSAAPHDGYILYVGSLSERKNINGIEAVAIQAARKFGIASKLIGSHGQIFRYSKPELPSDVAHLIEYCGHVENTQRLAAAYQGARVLLFPSFYEASPLPPIEAMHFGCPVVAADIPSLRERCGNAAEYCNPYSVDTIFAAVETVITNKNRANELIQNGYDRAARFSWEQQVLTVLDAFQRLRHI